MSKKLITLISTLLLVGSIGSAFAGDRTYDVYQNGKNIGTMSFPANRYPSVANRVNGTGISVRPQPLPDAAARQQAAQDRMNEWKKQDDQRRAAAQAQQDQWNKQYEARHNAAVEKQNMWNQQFAERQKAAQAQQQKWIDDSNRRQAAAQNGFDAWKAAR